MPAALLQSYREAVGDANEDVGSNEGLLDLFMLEKAAYEVNYEVSNRPEWLAVPLHGLTELLDRILPEKANRHG